MNNGIKHKLLTLTILTLMPFTSATHASQNQPFIRNTDRPYEITAGLQDRNIALWHSHGLFYDQRDDRWKWQRARVMTVVEDKYTMAYVLPYLLPMLERAGANVFLPRERDPQPYEYIVDNDKSEYTGGIYREEPVAQHNTGDRHTATHFMTGGHSGFGLQRAQYTDRRNPFTEGTFRRHNTSRQATAQACWIPEIKHSGWYWVSIAYTSEPNSVPDAHYTVYHSGGATRYTVDQRKGGGTWIYLGQFYFEAGADRAHASVVLDNSGNHNGVVTADAVRWGGGKETSDDDPPGRKKKARYKGEIPAGDLIQCYEKTDYTTGRVDRLWEAARYYLQWAGAPYEVYSVSQSMNDYRDDYNCRPWTNWLMYGSKHAPDSTGLSIDIDAAIAFHSDAGTAIDSIIGTMGIYSAKGDGRSRTFPNGKKRDASKRLTETVIGQVVSDIRANHCARWTDRQCHDLNYAETRRANVPTMILELLSHQNYDDMRYGLDPSFRFTVARAVYKGVARFICRENGVQCTIAPLPVNSFALEASPDADSLYLSWQPTADTLEVTARPEAYILYTAADGKGWDNGRLIHSNRITLPFIQDTEMRYKVTAVNTGGESVDSRTLSAYRTDKAKGTVMIVDGFDRVAAPEGFTSGHLAGFPQWTDHGVPDGRNLLYVGKQHDFDRRNPWITDDHAGWGQSDSNYDFAPPMGNDHSHIAVHGKAIAAAGYNYVSCTHEAFATLSISPEQYPVIDLILGEQRSTICGPDSNQIKYTAIYPLMQQAIQHYTAAGGSILVTGAYVVSDAWLGHAASEQYRQFIKNTLRAVWCTNRAAQNGQLTAAASPDTLLSGKWHFCQTLNDSIYEVESPDALQPAHTDARTVLRYTQNNTGAAVSCTADGYNTLVCGFPFETITNADRRTDFMKQALHFLDKH